MSDFIVKIWDGNISRTESYNGWTYDSLSSALSGKYPPGYIWHIEPKEKKL